MDHSGNATVSNKQKGFIFSNCAGFEFINKIIDSLSQSEHGFATIVVACKLFFCFMKNSGMFVPFMTFIFSEVLFNQEGLTNERELVFFCDNVCCICSPAEFLFISDSTLWNFFRQAG